MNGDDNLPPPDYGDPTGEEAIFRLLKSGENIPGAWVLTGPYGLNVHLEQNIVALIFDHIEVKPTRRHNGLRARLKKKKGEQS
ncbi:hypothetical protein BH09ACT6_BH09ACT6_05950 [soil metagenome]